MREALFALMIASSFCFGAAVGYKYLKSNDPVGPCNVQEYRAEFWVEAYQECEKKLTDEFLKTPRCSSGVEIDMYCFRAVQELDKCKDMLAFVSKKIDELIVKTKEWR